MKVDHQKHFSIFLFGEIMEVFQNQAVGRQEYF